MWKLTPAVMAASALHVAVWVGVHGGWHQGAPAAHPATAVAAMQVLPSLRVVPRPPAPSLSAPQAIDMAPAPVATLPELTAHGTQRVAPPPTPPQREVWTEAWPASEAAAQADAPGAVSEAAPLVPPAPQAAAAEANAASGFDPDRYWPRPDLTRPPVPRTVVAIDFPVGEPTPGRHKAVLALYIDDEGLVQRVDTSDAQLPEPYIAAARNAFLVARFEPGQIQGQPVRSLIHIEVQFDQAEAAPLQAPTRLSRSFAGLP